MNQYRRIVSYLYKYANGVKGENTGFVRVDTREEGIRLHLRIKDLRMMDECNLSMYFYFHKDDKLGLIFVDKFFCTRGNCEYKKLAELDFKEEEFDSLSGVVFLNGQKLLYGSCWDEKEIREEKLIFEDVKKRGENTDNNIFESVSEIENKSKEKNIITDVLEVSTEGEQVNSPYDTQLHTSEIDTELEEDKKQESIGLSKERILFEGAESIIQAARIDLQDITKLSHQEWKLADNLFLKQSYELEGHLMFAQIRMQNEKTVWVLGVPGIYTNRDKYLAGVFGFSDYIPLKQTDIRTGGRGYWIREVSGEGINSYIFQ